MPDDALALPRSRRRRPPKPGFKVLALGWIVVVAIHIFQEAQAIASGHFDATDVVALGIYGACFAVWWQWRAKGGDRPVSTWEWGLLAFSASASLTGI